MDVCLKQIWTIRNEHNEYPFCPEQVIVGQCGTTAKLIASLHNKQHYVVHYEYLKRALCGDLILKRIHQGVRFCQTAWLKPYVELNTHLRQEADNDFTRKLHKFYVNAVSGKLSLIHI